MNVSFDNDDKIEEKINLDDLYDKKKGNRSITYFNI